MDKIAVIGVGQTAFEREKKAETFADLVYEATNAALEDAGIAIADVDNIVTASNDFWDGRTISSMAVGDAAGAAFGEGKNISTVEGDGTFAALYGMSRILSGSYKTTLVVAHSKGSEGDNRMITNAYFDPVSERALGLDSITAAALQARAFLEHEGLREEDCAKVVAKNRAAGVKNPKAQLRRGVSVEEALASPTLASPLKRDDICPISDGAAAIILASEDFGKSRKPVWVQGVGLCADRRLSDRDLWESQALRRAAQAAYKMAGISDPKRELDAAEISEQFSYQELLWLKELGLGDPGRVNLSGGCLCAHAVTAAGLVRMIEAVLQLRGEAANQISTPRRALAHGQNGMCGQAHCVWILGK